MTNKIKGEIAIKAETGPEAGDYVLVLDLNALCELEEEFPNIMQGEVDISTFKRVRTLFHAGFSRYHSDKTEEQVGDIVHAVGLEQATDKLFESLAASFPEAKVKGENPRKAPAKAGAGTGR